MNYSSLKETNITVRDVLTIINTNDRIFIEPLHATNATRMIEHLSDIPDKVLDSIVISITGNDHKQIVIHTDSKSVMQYNVLQHDNERTALTCLS